MKIPSLLIAGLTALIIPLAQADPVKVKEEPKTTVVDPGESPKEVSPWDKDDGQWITIAGKVTEAGVNTFKLDYGEGAIIIEIDDYDRELEGFNIKNDDKVIVTGRIDADKDQKRSIEAASVYVSNIKKSFFASADDEEEVITKLRQASANGTGLALTGAIVFTAEKLMTIDNGVQIFDVSTELLPEDAFDKEGELQLKVGDKVTAYGTITDGFVDARKFVATKVIKR